MFDSAPARRTSRTAALLVLFAISGAPGLVAQVTWTRVLAAALGHEATALCGIVTAFFAGLAAGAWYLDSAVARSARPARWYAGLEGFSATWIAVGTALLPAANEFALRLSRVDSSAAERFLVGLGMALVLVGPAAAAMGATLPAMERAVASGFSEGRAVSALYAVNTAGAMMGVLAAVGWLMPVLGLRGTLWAAAGVQAVCGGVAMRLAPTPEVVRCAGSVTSCETQHEVSSRHPSRPSPGNPAKGAAPALSERGPDGVGSSGAGACPSGGFGLRHSDRFLFATAWVMGFLGIGFELLGIRALAQSTENTIQTFAAVLAVFLGGTALGAGSVRGWRRARPERSETLVPALGALALVVLAEAIVVAHGSSWWAAGRRGTWAQGIGGEVLLALAVFLAPTWIMGSVFAQVAQAAKREAGGVGRAIALNALGGAVSGPVWLVGLLPALGLRGAFLALGGLYGAWALVSGWMGGPQDGARSEKRVPSPWLGLAGIAGFGGLALVLMSFPFRLIDLPAGAVVTRLREGFLATVAVVRTADGQRTLRVNNHFQQGGTATAAAARRHAHLPLLLHPAPRRALFLGVGTGITLGAAASYAGLEADGVELLPEVVEALPEFEPENGAPQRRPGFRVVVADARRFVRVTTNLYDVVVADLFHPAEDGAGFLYTREHFEALRERLAPGGLVCQWLPLHQLDRAGFADVGRTFREVFPGATLWLLRFNVDVPVVGMVGCRERDRSLTVDPAALHRRLADRQLGEALRPLAWNDPVRMLGGFLADSNTFGRLVSTGTVATDDRPVVLFRAAAAAYRPQPPPHTRLVGLLDELTSNPGDLGSVLSPEAKGREELERRLESFRKARDQHLRGLALESEGQLRTAADWYVRSTEESPDYSAAYAQALLVASAFAREDPTFARGLLERLVRLRPEERLAKEMLARLERTP